MHLPQARIVKHGGQVYAPPPAPPVSRRRPGQTKEQMHEALALAVGMWPLFAVMMLIVGMFILATYRGAP